MKGTALALGFMLLFGSARAEDISISLAELPVHSFYNDRNELVGGFPELIRIVDEYYPDGTITQAAFPFGRSINNVAVEKFDAHVPLIRAGKSDELTFQYVDEPLLDVTFVIYSHKDAPVRHGDDLSKLAIDTKSGHARFFDFPINEVTSIVTGLRKLANKRSNAFIMEQDAVDKLITQFEMNSLHREKYATWDSSMIVAKSARGDTLNDALSAAIKAAKADPRYDPIARSIHVPYKHWQPYEP